MKGIAVLCAFLLAGTGLADDDMIMLQQSVMPHHSGALNENEINEAAVYGRAMAMTLDFLKAKDIAYLDVASDGAVLEKQAASAAETAPAAEKKTYAKGRYGFYLHTFGEPKACISQLRSIRKLYPAAPIYVMSDGGMNFTNICNEVGNANFQWRPAANDRWNPKPFLRRFREAAQWLETEYVVMLEPDVAIQGPIVYSPNSDAGGLHDANPKLKDGLRAYMEGLGSRASATQTYTLRWDHFGLAGGMYVRSDVAIECFNADCIDWAKAKSLDTHRVMSSDVAMPIVLAAKGYSYAPWDAVFQTSHDAHWTKQGQNISKPDRSFRHFGREEIKPHYREALTAEEALLVTRVPNIGNIICQGCVWASEEVCWQSAKLACPLSEPPIPDASCPQPLNIVVSDTKAKDKMKSGM